MCAEEKNHDQIIPSAGSQEINTSLALVERGGLIPENYCFKA